MLFMVLRCTVTGLVESGITKRGCTGSVIMVGTYQCNIPLNGMEISLYHIEFNKMIDVIDFICQWF